MRVQFLEKPISHDHFLERSLLLLPGLIAEIKLRAQRRIGEISRELETAEAHGGKIWLPTGGKPKIEIIKSVGLTKSTVNRYEHIAEIEE